MTKKFIKEVEIFTRHMRDPQNAALPDGIAVSYTHLRAHET